MTTPRRARAWVRGPGRPWVLGHRGARNRAPENTLAAFDLAVDEGADGVELDVRLARDGDVVVIHDPSLGRMTRNRDARRVEELDAKTLARVDLGGGATVPRLRDVLAWAAGRGARVNVELKRDVSDRRGLVLRVARLVAAERHAAERFILSSFDPKLVAALSYLLPWVPCGWLVEEPGPVPQRTVRERLVHAAALHPQSSLVTGESVGAWKRAGRPVNVWTVNDIADAVRLDALGIDTLITDEPAKILGALAR